MFSYTTHLLTLLFLTFTFVTSCPVCPTDTTSQAPMGSTSKSTIYFGYGSNLWLEQMRTRCPTSKYLGVARLDGYKWIINDRGYANVMQVVDEEMDGSSKFDNVVYGLVYSLKEKDERRLDRNEGVPVAYTKEGLNCIFWGSDGGKWVDVEKKAGELIEVSVVLFTVYSNISIFTESLSLRAREICSADVQPALSHGLRLKLGLQRLTSYRC